MVLLRLGEGELKNVAKGQEGREGDIVSLYFKCVFHSGFVSPFIKTCLIISG